jgi:Flp pilus assembly protein TadD
VRTKAGESADDIARLDIPPEDATTSNWQALEEYTLAEKSLSAGKRKEGIIGLQRATQIDPEFALASARLGDQLMAAGSWAEALAAYRQAMSTAGRQRLTRYELDRVRGIYAIDTRDDATAVAQFRDLSSYYPEDWLAWFYRAAPLLRLGKYAEAQACLERALALKPGQRSVLITLASLALINNDPAQAQHWIDALKSSGQRPDAAWAGAEAAFAEANAQDVLVQVHLMRQGTDRDRTLVSYLLESDLQGEVGHPDRSITALNEGLHAAETLGDDAEKVLFLMERGSMECRLSQWDACIEDARAALTSEHSPNAALLTSQFLARYGFFAPPHVQRQIDAILQLAEPAADGDQPGPLFEMARLRTRASRELLHHDCGPALRDFQQAAHIDAPAVSHEYLGDAYALCATVEQNREKASSLRQQAADSYAWGAFHPAFLWYEPNRHPPGSATDQLQAWLALNRTPDPRNEAARQRLLALRGDQPAEDLSRLPFGLLSPERKPQPSTN